MTTCRLYRFSVPPYYDAVGGTPQVYAYTSSARPVTYSGQVYDPEEIDHASLEIDGSEVTAGALAVQAPFDLEIVQIIALRQPAQSIEVVVYEVDEEDPNGSPALVIFRGEVNGWQRVGQAASLECFNSLSSLNTEVPRGRFSSMCRWQLYGEGCRLTASSWRQNCRVISTDKDALQIVVMPVDLSNIPLPVPVDPGYWIGGFLRGYTTINPILVLDHDEGTAAGGGYEYELTLKNWSPQIAELVPDGSGHTYVALYPGCDRNHNTCREKFNNLANFGGFEFVPQVGRSPFFGGFQ